MRASQKLVSSLYLCATYGQSQHIETQILSFSRTCSKSTKRCKNDPSELIQP